jgi:hypothetical protein
MAKMDNDAAKANYPYIRAQLEKGKATALDAALAAQSKAHLDNQKEALTQIVVGPEDVAQAQKLGGHYIGRDPHTGGYIYMMYDPNSAKAREIAAQKERADKGPAGAKKSFNKTKNDINNTSN